MSDDPRFVGGIAKGDKIVVSYRFHGEKNKQESRVTTVLGEPTATKIKLGVETDGPFYLSLDRDRRAKKIKIQTKGGLRSMGFVTSVKIVDE